MSPYLLGGHNPLSPQTTASAVEESPPQGTTSAVEELPPEDTTSAVEESQDLQTELAQIGSSLSPKKRRCSHDDESSPSKSKRAKKDVK